MLALLRIPVDSGNAAVRGGIACDSELKKPKEQQAPVTGIASVEAENELVKITLKMLWLRTALVRSLEDPLEERKDAVNAGQ